MAKFNINDEVALKKDLNRLKGIIKDSFHNGYLVLWNDNNANISRGKDLVLYKKPSIQNEPKFHKG